MGEHGGELLFRPAVDLGHQPVEFLDIARYDMAEHRFDEDALGR